MERNRTYFSWSQYSLWKSSKLQFYKKYCLGEEGPNLQAWAKGKEFGRYKETKQVPTFITDPLLRQVGDETPELEIIEHELKCKIGEYELLCYLDTCEFDLTEFYEYKTGKDAWTQTLVNKHEQLDFYALCIYIKSGETILPKCKLYWIETEDIEMTDGSIEKRYTGHIEEFVREFTEEDMVSMMTKIVTSLKEIEAYEFKEIELNENLVNRYIKLNALSKKIKSEMDLIKLNIKNDLIENNVDYGVGKNGKFSISKRTSYDYSIDLKLKESNYKTEIDELKRKEKNSGAAKAKVTKTLLFKLIKTK